MSSSDYFDDELDEGFLDELDAIETSHTKSPLEPLAPQTSKPSTSTSKPTIPVPKAPASRELRKTTTLESDDYDLTFDYDESELQKLDGVIEDAYQGKVAPTTVTARSSAFAPSKGGLQTTLFGDVLAPATNRTRSEGNNRGEGSSRGPMQRSKSSGQLCRKTKVWDHTAFSKTGKRKIDKGKGKARDDENDAGEQDEQIEFEQFPAPFVPGEYVHLLKDRYITDCTLAIVGYVCVFHIWT